jgi:hypothetical protein
VVAGAGLLGAVGVVRSAAGRLVDGEGAMLEGDGAVLAGTSITTGAGLSTVRSMIVVCFVGAVGAMLGAGDKGVVTGLMLDGCSVAGRSRLA